MFFSKKLAENKGIVISKDMLRNIFKRHDKLSIKAHKETKCRSTCNWRWFDPIFLGNSVSSSICPL